MRTKTVCIQYVSDLPPLEEKLGGLRMFECFLGPPNWGEDLIGSEWISIDRETRKKNGKGTNVRTVGP